MSSSAKHQKNIRHTKQGGQQEPPQKQQTTHTKRFWRWIELVAKFLGLYLSIVGSYYAFSPKLSAIPYVSLDPSNPFATPFEVRNNSILSIRSIKITGHIRNLIDARNNKVINVGFERTIPPIPVLNDGEATTFLIPYAIGHPAPITYADVEIIISYRPVLLPYRNEKHIRFSTGQSEDGSLHWLPRAISE